MKIKFLKKYAYAFNGYEVVRYKAGDIIETESEELVKTAVDDCAAESCEEPKKKTSKKA